MSKVKAKVELFKLEIVLREASNKDKIRDRPAIYTRIFLLLEAVEAVDQAQEQEVQAPTIMCYPTEILWWCLEPTTSSSIFKDKLSTYTQLTSFQLSNKAQSATI